MKKILNSKLLFLIPFLIIIVISLLNMYNAKYISTSYSNSLLKQIIWYILGILILITFNKVNNKYIFKYSYILYIIGIFLLIYVLLFGKVINGSRAWINLKYISFQPSEFMKLALSLLLSNMANLYKKTNIKEEVIYIAKSFLLCLIPSILVFLEPDTGAIIFYIVIFFTSLLLSNISFIWYILAILVSTLCTCLFIILYLFNKDILINMLGTSIFYRIERLITFKTMSSYQLENAFIGIGSSLALMNGFGKVRIYIPEAPTDFIFAFSISNFGYLIGFLLLLCFILIDIYLINKFIHMKKGSLKYFLASFISIFLINQIINIGMNLGLLPIIGIPLPFLSYGGSTLIVLFLYLGIIFNNKMV